MLSLIFGLLGLTTAAANPLIAPGRSLGNIQLGASPETLTSLGPAATSDAAMQKAWATWYGGTAARRTQLDVYTAASGPDMRKTIQVVRATSPFFHTAGGVHSGSSLAAVRAACGPFALAGSYRPKPGVPARYLYDNARAGIAFETDGTTPVSHCTAVLVHLPGKSMKDNYLSVTSYLQLLAGR
ncbi:hypothetical protein [Hymenobacter rigui]|uniref:Uncharacterized protein n=1 Tax=Hymenobacter rigui TaxID=334424 RepID=A0A3R9NZN6_9BACT|nr:hypothetical protein [Hymenobacter rigui]RSK45388.1 hypothetical protein EI291_18730 [Hymenobacter rigui]